MKISVAWIFDFIQSPVDQVDVTKLVHLFNTRSAEIEHYEKVEYDLSSFYLAKVIDALESKTILFVEEVEETVELPSRLDVRNNQYYLVAKKQGLWQWVSFLDLQSDKEGLMPALHVSEKILDGSWRDLVEKSDYILDVDNKSINHRPDLWGHYGIAREVASFMGLQLKSLDSMLAQQQVDHFNSVSVVSKKNPIEVTVDSQSGCSRFAGLYADSLTHQDSDIAKAFRLLKVGAKPIDAVVDLTNYVMFEIGHPMHVFDAQTFNSKKLSVRLATAKESLTLLDGQNIALRSSDIVVTDSKQPVALAGIMGGQQSAYKKETKAIYLEAAGFDAATIRKTAQHFKLRTEASTRFEKTLDPMQNITVLQRFVYWAQQDGILGDVNNSITSVGLVLKPMTCTISHAFIKQKVGVDLSSVFICKTLHSLGFKVEEKVVDKQLLYHVTVPTFRVKKDIEIKEDILEELVRMYGFENITYKLPHRIIQPFSVKKTNLLSDLKRQLAFGCKMHEVRDYLFYDESFIQRLSFDPESTIRVKNPVSENWRRLVTSLVPHLLKNVELNHASKDHIRLFECNSIWPNKNGLHTESKSLAGIVFDKQVVDFYDIKRELQALWDLLNIEVIFKKADDAIAPWYDRYKTAELWVQDKQVGYAGMLSENFIRPILAGQGFVFELDLETLLSFDNKSTQFKPWSKYQNVSYDISMLVPLKVSADMIKSAILQSSSYIFSVSLVDFFEKEDWQDQRALTFRYIMSPHDKTLAKKEIEEIVEKVVKSVEKYDAKIR